jgi:hypothetical protein
MNFKPTPFIGFFTNQGKIYSTYKELTDIFGKPYFGPGREANPPIDRSLSRVSCQWRVKFEDGTVAIIHDDRQKETNMGFYQWFISGDTGRAFILVKEVVETHRKNKVNTQ